MGLLDKLKSLFSGKAKEAVESLNLDEGLVTAVKGLVEKLQDSDLGDVVAKAVENFKPLIEKVQNKEISVDSFIESAKSFLGNLGDNLPEEITGLVEKVKGLLNK